MGQFKGNDDFDFNKTFISSIWTDVCPFWTDACPDWTDVCPNWTNVCPNYGENITKMPVLARNTKF